MMPRRTTMTVKDAAQFRAAVGQVVKNTIQGPPAYVEQLTDQTVERLAGTNSGQAQLRALVDRVERLAAEKDEVAEQIKEVYAKAKAEGFDVKVLRLVVRRRKRRRQEVLEEDEAVQLYEGQLE